MKKLIVAFAAIVAATLVSGSAFAISGAGPAIVQAPSAAVKVSGGCYHRPRHHYHRASCGCSGCCGGYYSLYTYATPCGCYSGCGGWSWGGGFFGGILGW